MSQLPVWWTQRLVGTVELERNERMAFAYSAEWLGMPTAFPISLSLPLRAERYGAEAHSFFANLLPEADVRTRLCQRLKVTPGNDFELLRLIGGECAGALTLGDARRRGQVQLRIIGRLRQNNFGFGRWPIRRMCFPRR